MRFAVLRSFASPSRRFSVGQIVTAEEIDGPALPDEMLTGGFLQIENPDAPVAPLMMRRRAIAPVKLPPPVEMEHDDAVE